MRAGSVVRGSGATLVLSLAIGLAACAGFVPSTDGCAEMGMSVARCQAIVDDARRRLGDRPPVTGIAVERIEHGARDTLRSLQLVAIVRFVFVDGTDARIEVYCGGRNARTLVCTDHPSAT